ncbi:MAG: hypothetical protein KDB27_35040, partial [Planctomycetales bacterium]|nr:hypothetical protein [Planctomycetales bacterium]
MQKVPAGGAATINGVLYQMLWALSRIGRLSAIHRRSSDSELVDVTLVLEPSDGGDQREQIGDRRVIQQLKARSSGVVIPPVDSR